MNLYFLDSNDRQHLVAMGVDDKNFNGIMMIDLERRKPGYKVHYTRQWWDDYFRLWIDFGSHVEFYILQDEDRALNVVKDSEYSIDISPGECEMCAI